MQIKCDTCLRYPVQIGRHGFGKHLARSALVKLRSTRHSIAFIGKFSYVTQKCTQVADGGRRRKVNFLSIAGGTLGTEGDSRRLTR
jgi:hypothetical protein